MNTATQLEYVSDASPGYTRCRAGKGFYYLDSRGRRVRNASQIARIQSLAIPPAYEDVWICPHERGHIQATARDARGRKQYLYHPQWRATRDSTKFDRMRMFAHVLPRLRRRVNADLARDGIPKEKVLAALVKLLDRTGIRVGNEEYARENGSFGLTTLRNRHVAVNGEELKFEFRGKSGVPYQVALKDRRLARVIRRCLDIPGQELFQYVDEKGTRRAITSQAVNAYLQAIAKKNITAKDFRTWTGSVVAYAALCASGEAEEGSERKSSAKSRTIAALKLVSTRLGNTPAVCKRAYVHPAILEACECDDLAAEPAQTRGLSEPERRFLGFLERSARMHKKKPATKAGQTQRSQESFSRRSATARSTARAAGSRGSGRSREHPRMATSR